MLLGLLVMATAVVVPLWWACCRYGYTSASARELQEIVAAGRRFNVEYGTWPAARTCGYVDCRFGLDHPNREVLNPLRAVEGPGNETNGINPRRVVFLQLPAFRDGVGGIDSHGDCLDPWGVPVQIILDTDLNGVCDEESTVHGAGIQSGIVAWSYGPDGRSDTPDDILSWK